MDDMSMVDEQNVQIDQDKLKRITIKIYNLERENTKTSKFSEKEIKTEIQKIIEEEVNKCY